MSEAAAAPGTARLSPNQRSTLAALWFSAPLLVMIQYFALRHLNHLNGQLPRPWPLRPSARWVCWGTTLPLLAVTLALALQYRWMSSGWRSLAALGLTMLLPLDALAGFAVLLSEDASVELPTGRRFAVTPDDHAFEYLEEQVGPLGLYSRVIGRPFMGPGVRLVPSLDQRWLVVAYDHQLTDCYDILREEPTPCPGIDPSLDQSHSDKSMSERSVRISRLTGVRA
jgi:hypothetical protein